MKTPYYHIYQVLRLNRFIVLAVLLMAFLSSMFSLFQVRKIHREALERSFAIDRDGMVIPLVRAQEKDFLEVELKSHLDLFHRSFYELNTSNYQEQLDRALWLGNQSVDEVYRQKKAEGVYNRLLQYSLIQRVSAVHSQIDQTREPFAFTTTVHFEVLRGNATDRYELQTTGKLLRVDRHFPHNPHGFIITEFFENHLKKLPNEDR